MKTFNVLDRDVDIQKSYLLEASAGTGKTFSIENIFVRLLLEEACPLENILVVTFTDAATRDLKTRIHTNIEKALVILNSALQSNCQFDLSIPDFLQHLIEKGLNKVLEGKQ